ncbi:MAG: hypothetical protein COC06_10635 [Bacteroidales bacterium]|nr:MAG: hypothetical protein COC06_10635 [Bacteroidales bacterium]
MEEIISWEIGGKTAIWLPASNKYILAHHGVDLLIQLISKSAVQEETICFCKKQFSFSSIQAQDFEKDVREIFEQEFKETATKNKVSLDENIDWVPNVKVIRRYYLIFGQVFLFVYSSADEERLIHPKFAHLETSPTGKSAHEFGLYVCNGNYVLFVDKQWVGSWTKENEHYMGGMFSMKLVQKLYCTEEKQWLGIFHAAGISNGNECLLFAGESGAGKSTLSSILMHAGMDVLADDFLPVESNTGMACRFPAAISVKKEALELLSADFPNLKNAKEYQNPEMGKIVRYLPNLQNGQKALKVPCKGLVFVQYKENSGLELIPLKQEEAFERLIPDSWISPYKLNAKRFLDWFAKLRCYQITYSDNDKMVEAVKGLFSPMG